VNIALLHDDCDVAVVGAGPYGLAVAAHLKAARIETRAFGDPMSFWRDHMPQGMMLRSPWRASHIADPERRYTLDAFAHRLAIPYQDQLPIEHFIRYGEWFQRLTVRDLDTRKVVRVEDAGGGFSLVLEDGEAIYARRVVMATGLAGHQHRPAIFDNLPSALVSHTSEHARLDLWRGKRVAVVGRGLGACESAALLREAGADVEIICRGDIRWPPAARDTNTYGGLWAGWLDALRTAPSALGVFPLSWLNELPGTLHRLSPPLRTLLTAGALRPAPAAWLRRRFTGVRILAGEAIRAVRTMGNQVALHLNTGLRVYDHVLLATGYRIDVARTGILSPLLARRIAGTRGVPVLGRGFESSVPGLHFVGASAVKSYGPLMSVVAGAGYTARSVTEFVLAQRALQRRDLSLAMNRFDAEGDERAS
jgi:cation diffusion facilitator CzcD-associated flavoprotein CzcO